MTEFIKMSDIIKLFVHLSYYKVVDGLYAHVVHLLF